MYHKAGALHLCTLPVHRVEFIIKLLGIQRCADTVVGNQLLRGVSGGEKKRVTTAEMLVGGKVVLLMDEISTGAAGGRGGALFRGGLDAWTNAMGFRDTRRPVSARGNAFTVIQAYIACGYEHLHASAFDSHVSFVRHVTAHCSQVEGVQAFIFSGFRF